MKYLELFLENKNFHIPKSGNLQNLQNPVEAPALFDDTAPEVGTSWKPLSAGNLMVSAAPLETLWSPKSADNPMESAPPEELEKVGDVKKEKKREAPAEPKPAPVWRVPANVTPQAVLKAARRINPQLKLSIQERHELAVDLACLDCGIDPQSY